MRGDDGIRSRVLVLAPTGRDAALTCALLGRAGLATTRCADLGGLLLDLEKGGGTAVVTEEAFNGPAVHDLVTWVEGQASWSDFPFLILLTRDSHARPSAKDLTPLAKIGNVTLLERPVGVEALVSAVRSALRARRRQYQVHDALAALAESERRYRTLADAIPQLVWMADSNGEFEYVNQQWVEFTHVPAADQMGSRWLTKVIHPDDRPRVQKKWAASVAGDEDFDVEFRIGRSNGAYHYFKARATAVRDLHGQVTQWFGACTDISDIVEARATLNRSRERLEQLVAERTQSLEAANAKLTHEIAERQRTEAALQQSQKLEAIGQLTSGLAHDFNNLLTTIHGNLELAAERSGDESVRRHLHAALGAAKRGADLTQQLLAFSRKQYLAPQTLNLNRLAHTAIDMLLRTIGATVKVELLPAEDLWPTLADPTQIELVLLNLSINARDAMPDGGTITIRTANVPRNLAPVELARGDYTLLSIEDTGTGMPADVLRKAVEPFFTTKPVGKGSGLGLSMVQGVVTQSGGGMRIESHVGKGTVVSVYLPRANATVPAVDSQADVPIATPHKQARILVVDDDPEVRQLTVSCLQNFGYDVTSAENGITALTRLPDLAPLDLLVVDLAMPDINGVEVIRRARESMPHLRALLVTGFADTRAFSSSGGISDRLLRKPFAISRLGQAVAEELQR